jgi:hypothetical protein
MEMAFLHALQREPLQNFALLKERRSKFGKPDFGRVRTRYTGESPPFSPILPFAPSKNRVFEGVKEQMFQEFSWGNK